jgi:hypothetical protein
MAKKITPFPPLETSFRTISPPKIPGPVGQTKFKNIMAEMRF